MLAKRLEEAKVAEVMQPNNVQVVDVPTLPDEPVGPRKVRTIIISTLIGFLFSCGLIVCLEMMNRTIRTDEDVKNFLDLPVLGAIPDEESMSLAMAKQKEMDNNKPGFMSKVKEYVWKK